MTLVASADKSTRIQDAERLKTLYVINDMLKQVVADGLEINIILPRLLRIVIEELGAYGGSLIILNERLQVQHVSHVSAKREINELSPFLKETITKGLFGWVIRQKQSAMVQDTCEDKRWLARPEHPTNNEPWSAVAAPFIIRSRAVGAVLVTKPGRDQFNQNDIRLLTAIANQATSTLESARLYQESKRRASELSAFIAATLTFSNTLDLPMVLQMVAEQIAAFGKAEGCLIFDIDSIQQQVTRRAFSYSADWEQQPIHTPHHYALAQNPRLAEAVNQARPVRISYNDQEKSSPEYQLLEETQSKTILFLPLLSQNRPIGLAEVIFANEEPTFSNDSIYFIQSLANQAAITIENAKLYEKAQRQLKISALLHQASHVINSTLDTNQIMQSLLAHMNELLNAEALSIAIVDKQSNELVFTVAEGMGSDKIVGLRLPSNQGVSGWVMEHGRPALVPDTSKDPRFVRSGDRRTGYNTQAMICAPMQVKGEVIGTIQAINPNQGTFTEEDLNLLVNLANLASTAVANAEQFALTQAAETRYLSLFEDSIDPILLTNQTGHIVETNRRALDFLGYSHRELSGLLIHMLHPPGSQGPELGRLAFSEPGQVAFFTSRIITKAEHIIPVEVYGKRVIVRESELYQWIYRDISKQVELESMREDLMAMLVHDLQSPLGNIISSLELLQYELTDNNNNKPFVESIIEVATKSSQRLLVLIRSLLDITHLEAGHAVTNRVTVSLPGLVQDAQEIIQQSLTRRSIELVYDFPADLPLVLVDEDMIRRVFINLLDNAVKYTPNEQQIRIRGVAVGSGRVHVSVSDQGPGIPRQYRTLIFEKFRRLDGQKTAKGMGLGLAFCRVAVEAHGGNIWVDDAPGGGSRFNFTLPVAENSHE